MDVKQFQISLILQLQLFAQEIVKENPTLTFDTFDEWHELMLEYMGYSIKEEN